MKPATIVDVSLRDAAGSALHIPDIFVDFRFFQNGRYCYGFRFGPTNALGTLTVSYDDFEIERRQQGAAQPWDFKSSLEACDPTITILILSAAELREASARALEWDAKARGPVSWLISNNRLITATPVSTVADTGHVVVNISCHLSDGVDRKSDR